MQVHALKETPLHSAHVFMKAKMQEFAGWDMPICYNSILDEHRAVRLGTGMFDVSHMGQIFVAGKESGQFLNHLLTNEILSAPLGSAIYSHMANEKGGVIDDVIVYRITQKTDLVVVNASRIEADWNWMRKAAENFEVALSDESPNYGIIALQGPSACKMAKGVNTKIALLNRFGLCQIAWKSHEMIVARTGYTGEDGFEFIAPKEILKELWDFFNGLAQKEKTALFAPCGLGARDTLRLEAGYPLWGHELGEDITPLEAGYEWVVKWKKNQFIGREALDKQKKEGLTRKLFGFLGNAPGPIPRAHSVLLTLDGKTAGTITSGSFSPMLSKPIAMGFINREFWEQKEFKIDVNGRYLNVSVTGLPFYKAKKNKN